MINLLVGGNEPPKPRLLQVVTEQVTEQKIETKELTLEEKIANNYYECDETKYYIRADNAMCLLRPEYRASTGRYGSERSLSSTIPKNAATAPSGWFPAYQCTWYVWTRRAVGQWNDASDWYWQAQRDGWETGTTPRAGAIGWEPGHVVYIESVNGNRVFISERNYDLKGSYRERWANDSEFKYIY